MNQSIIPNLATQSKPKRLTKKAKILAHLQSGQTLTQWECTHLYRHLRLGAVIFELREQGYDIETITCKNATDNGTHAKYVLRGVE